MRLRRTPQAPASAAPRTPADINEQVLAAAVALPQNPRLVVFESMAGRQYSDSPRAISEALQRLDPDLTPLWSVRRGALGVPDGVETVTRRTPEWIAALASARVWVDNQGFARWLAKPERVHYLQTWHGTPLKKMGWNDPTLTDVDPHTAAELQASYDRWDAVTAPSQYFVETIVDAFHSKADVLRLGLPRNDVLTRVLTSDERTQRSAELGLEQDRRIVLFAPTRTADPDVSIGRWRAAERLIRSDREVLFRGHYSDDLVDTTDSRVKDVSHVADMADLLAVADVLVTDYSSSMFDFALTDRPILLFQPDQATYLHERGTYFDIREFPPGPIAATEHELAALLDSVDEWSSEWSGRRAEYRKRFGTYESGDAAERVVKEHLLPLLTAT